MKRPRDFRGRRWLGIVLRSLHLVGVVMTGAGILGDGTSIGAGAVLMLLTGFAMYGIDLWQHHDFWKEVAGVFVIAKLGMVAGMLLVPSLAAALFWLVVVTSSVISHAPRMLRHRRVVR